MKQWLYAGLVFLLLTSSLQAQAGPWGGVGRTAQMPPVDYLISSYQATAVVQPEMAKFKATIDLKVFATGWIEIALLSREYAVTAFQGPQDDQQPRLLLTRDSQAGYNLLCGQPGSYVVQLEFVSKVTTKGLQACLAVPFVPAVSGVTTLNFNTEISDLEVQGEVQVEKSTAAGKSRVVLYSTAGLKQTRLRWKETPRMELVKPLLFANQKIDVFIGRGLLRSDSRIEYTILQGAVRQLQLLFPADCNLMEVSGNGIKNWNTRNQGEQQSLLVELVKPVKERYTLTLVLERPTGSIPGSCTLPSAGPQEVRQEKGLISVYSMKALKIEPGQVTGASQVDVHDTRLHRKKIKDGQYRLGLAYKYLTRPFAVEVRVSQIKPKVTATTESLVQVSREAIRATHWVFYDIRDAGVFSLRFKLDQESKLLDIKGNNINNWRIKNEVVEVDLRSMAQGPYTLTVETEKSIQGQKQVLLPALQLFDVTRQTGYLAVSPRLDTKVEAVTDQQVTQIDIKELPARLRNAPEGVSLAYRYLKLPYRIPVTVGSIQPEVDASVLSSFTIKEKELSLDACINYDIRKAGIFELRLRFPAQMRLVDTVYGELIDDWRIDREKHLLIVNFRSKVDGKYTLKLSATCPVESIRKTLQLPVLQPLNVKKDRGFIAVQTETSVRLKTAQAKDVAEIDVKELPAYFKALGRKIALAYKYFRQPWHIALAVEPIESVVTAELFALAAIGDGLEQTSVRLDYQIQYAGVATFYLRFPKGAKNINITGQAIKHRGPAQHDPQLWTVSLQSKVKEHYALYVTFERKMAQTSGTVVYQGVQAEKIERETGFIAVAPRGNVEIIPISEGIRGIHAIDVTEIPKKFRAGITIPIIWAFKYISHPYTITLEATKHEDVEALVAIADLGKLTTVVSPEGETMTDFTLIVKNNRKQFLRLVLPPATDILDAFVGGRPVRIGEELVPASPEEYLFALKEQYQAALDQSRLPATLTAALGRQGVNLSPQALVTVKQPGRCWLLSDKRQQRFYRLRKTDEQLAVYQLTAQHVTLVPISGVAAPGASFPVKLIYETKTSGLGYLGGLTLACPQLDLPVLRLGWELRLPRQYRLALNYGDMRYAVSPTQLNRQVEKAQNRYLSWFTGRRNRRAQIDNQIQHNLEKQIEQNKQLFSGSGSAVSPHMMKVLTQGRTFYFEKLLATPQDQKAVFVAPGTLRLYFVKSSMQEVLFWALILGFVVGGWFLRQAPTFWKIKFPVILALVFMGLYTLKSDCFPQLLEAAIAMLWLLFGVFSVEGLGRWAYHYAKSHNWFPSLLWQPAAATPPPSQTAPISPATTKRNRQGPPFYDQPRSTPSQPSSTSSSRTSSSALKEKPAKANNGEASSPETTETGDSSAGAGRQKNAEQHQASSPKPSTKPENDSPQADSANEEDQA